MRVNLRTVGTLLMHNPPLLLRKALKRVVVECSRRIRYPKGPVTWQRRGVRFACNLDDDPYMREIFFGAYEMVEVDLMRRVLRRGDTAIDVGASIGYLSGVMAGCVGREGQVHCFEPVPDYFERLQAMTRMNPDYTFVLNRCALGETEGHASLQITRSSNIGWNTMVPDYMPAKRVGCTLEVPVRRLDRYIEQKGLKRIGMIKIDTEGFEYPVLKGLEAYLAHAGSEQKPCILVEISEPANKLLGCSVQDLFNYMGRFSYRAFHTVNWKRPVDAVPVVGSITEVLFRPVEA